MLDMIYMIVSLASHDDMTDDMMIAMMFFDES